MARWQGGFSLLAQNVGALKADAANNLRMMRRGKICWQCQKESRFEKGALLDFKSGVYKYVCKACMDAKHAKQELKENT